MLRYKALGLILRLACDLPTMRACWRRCVFCSVARWGKGKDSRCVRTKRVYWDYIQGQRYAKSHPNAGVEYILYIASKLESSVA